MTVEARIHSERSLTEAIDGIVKCYKENGYVYCTYSNDKGKSISQHNMVYALYRSIADQLKDQGWTYSQVRNHCKLYIGLRQVLVKCPDYIAKNGELLNSLRDLPEEKKLKLMEVWPVLRKMKSDHVREYIDIIQTEFADLGCIF